MLSVACQLYSLSKLYCQELRGQISSSLVRDFVLGRKDINFMWTSRLTRYLLFFAHMLLTIRIP